MATENGRKLFPELIGRIVQYEPANLAFFRFKEEITFNNQIMTKISLIFKDKTD